MVQIVSVLLVLKSIKSVILLPRILLPLRNARKNTDKSWTGYLYSKMYYRKIPELIILGSQISGQSTRFGKGTNTHKRFYSIFLCIPVWALSVDFATVWEFSIY